MRDCSAVEIQTPKKVRLNGLWWGPRSAKRAVIWIHGLGSSAFSKLDIVEKLFDEDTAVLTFNNRGHDVAARVPRGKKSFPGGAGFEIFTDCVDDIEGAITYAKRCGAKEIFLIGHSTGCQKPIYWASKKGKEVKGIVLLAPISDFTATKEMPGHRAALAQARGLWKKGKKHALVTNAPMLIDAQRYISLYSGDSAEEVFPYWDGARTPKALRSVKAPLLVLLAQQDEYADRPAKKIQDWFADHIKVGDHISIIPRTPHSFKGQELLVARTIRAWMKTRVEKA